MIRNEANVYRHFKVTQRVVNEPIPEWVKKAQAGFKSINSHVPKDIEWAKRSVKIPPQPKRML